MMIGLFVVLMFGIFMFVLIFFICVFCSEIGGFCIEMNG